MYADTYTAYICMYIYICIYTHTYIYIYTYIRVCEYFFIQIKVDLIYSVAHVSIWFCCLCSVD